MRRIGLRDIGLRLRIWRVLSDRAATAGGQDAPAERSKAGSARPERSGADAEDEDAYSIVIRLLREGRAVEATKVAQAYLHQFPDGLRRREMSRIARQPRS